MDRSDSHTMADPQSSRATRRLPRAGIAQVAASLVQETSMKG